MAKKINVKKFVEEAVKMYGKGNKMDPGTGICIVAGIGKEDAFESLIFNNSAYNAKDTYRFAEAISAASKKLKKRLRGNLGWIKYCPLKILMFFDKEKKGKEAE